MVWPSQIIHQGATRSNPLRYTGPNLGRRRTSSGYNFAISEASPWDHATAAIGRPVAHIVALRRISRSVAIMLQTGPDAMPQPAIVNDL